MFFRSVRSLCDKDDITRVPAFALTTVAALFLAMGATSRSVEGWVAVAYQAIGMTLHKR